MRFLEKFQRNQHYVKMDNDRGNKRGNKEAINKRQVRYTYYPFTSHLLVWN